MSKQPHSEEDTSQLPRQGKARYFFHVIDGEHETEDPEGIECTSLDEVAAEAVEGLPIMMEDTVPEGDRREIAVKVTDESGKVVLRATLSLRIERFD